MFFFPFFLTRSTSKFWVVVLGGWGPSVSIVVRITDPPPFIGNEKAMDGRGPTTPGLADLRSPCLLTTYKSWDDPPSFALFVSYW